MKTYRVAILGCRGRGGAAARAYAVHARTEVVALCDLLPERMHALGDELGIAARYGDFHQMIRTEAPDIVVIPTATELHYELSMAVLEYGVHIDVEKPICTDLSEADQLLALARKKGVRIAVHHQGRSGAAMKAVKAAIAEGKIGQLRSVAGSGKGYYAGYGLMNIGTHVLNAMLGVVGSVRAVTAIAQVDGRPVQPDDVLIAAGGMGYVVGEDITAGIEFASGVQGVHLQQRFSSVDSRAYRVEFAGSEGRLLWRTDEAWLLPDAHYIPGETDWQPLPIPMPLGFDPLGTANEAEYSYVDDFVCALDTGTDHECSGAEGLHVLEVLLGIFESAATGTRVALPQADRTHPLVRWRASAGMEPPQAGLRPYAEWLREEDRRLGRL